MKKLLLFLTLFVYVVVSTGFAVSIHYCMDNVDSIQLGEVSRDHCSVCGMPLQFSKGCCKDEVKVVKLQVDQTLAKISTVNFSLPAVVSSSTPFRLASFSSGHEREEPVAHGPPLNKQETYLQNCVFRL